MKNKTISILLLVVVAVVLYIAAINTFDWNKTDSVFTKEEKTTDVITVYGQGKVSLDPDVAYITLGYENMDKDAKTAQDTNLDMMNDISKALIDAEVAEENIKTVGFNVNQRNDYVNGQSVLVGYNVQSYITITVTDVDAVSSLMQVAFDMGSNLFRGISFDLLDRQQAYLDALDLAIQRAGEKAEAVAEKSNRKLGDVIEIMESGSPSTYSTMQYSNYLYGQATEALSYSRDNTSAISEGLVEITASVNIIYSLD